MAPLGILLQERLSQPTRPIGAKSNCYAGVVSIETLLEMARRHVREGTERVVRQEALVAQLARDARFASQFALAKDVLGILRESLDLMERHLREIEKRPRV